MPLGDMRLAQISNEKFTRFRYQIYSHDEKLPIKAMTEISKDKNEYINKSPLFKKLYHKGVNMTLESRTKRAEEQLHKVVGDWCDYVTTSDVAKVFGYQSATSARKYTYGCRKYGRKYYIPEVAAKMAAEGIYEV